MLSKNQEKLIRSLKTKKGRQKSGFCLVEGEKVMKTAGKAVEFTFSATETPNFKKLVTTETPQNLAAVARIPSFDLKEIKKRTTIVVLDGIQDPGNLGSIFRLCLGFKASLLLIESADPTNPKVIRSSVGSMFQVPWLEIPRNTALSVIKDFDRPTYRLEKKRGAKELKTLLNKKNDQGQILIAGSEGQGIQLPLKAPSVFIEHDAKLESLNVGHALAIALYSISNN